MNDTKKAKLSISYSFDDILKCFGLLKPLNYKPTHMHVYIYREREREICIQTCMCLITTNIYVYLCIHNYRERQRERNVYSFFSFADSLMYTELVTLLNATNLKMGPQSHTPFVDIQQILIAGCRWIVEQSNHA